MPDVNNLKVMSKLLNVSVDYLLDDEKLGFNEITEAIHLEDYEKSGKCRDKRDAVCFAKNKDASAIYALISGRKLSKAEWIIDFAVQPGIVELLDRVNEIAGYYLVEKGGKQYFVKVTNDFIPGVYCFAKNIRVSWILGGRSNGMENANRRKGVKNPFYKIHSAAQENGGTLPEEVRKQMMEEAVSELREALLKEKKGEE